MSTPKEATTLDPAVRTILRKIVGDDVIARSQAMAEVSSAFARRTPAGDLIALDGHALVEDAKHPEWWLHIIATLFLAIAETEVQGAADVRGLRQQAVHLVELGERVTAILRFLSLFANEDELAVARAAGLTAVETSADLVGQMTAEDDDAYDAFGAKISQAMTRIVEEHFPAMASLPERDVPPVAGAQAEFRLLFGVDYPEDAPRWHDVCVLLQDAGHSLAELGQRQLGYLGAFESPNPWSEENYLSIAFRIGQSAFPLLAHQAAFLTGELLSRARARDEEATRELITTFHNQHAPWIIEAGPKFWAAREAHQAGDRASIINAYRLLTEGVLRRYGALVINLEELVSDGAVTTPIDQYRLADVESRLEGLANRGAELPALLLLFTERSLRNADAHVNVVVDRQGALAIAFEDGSVETFDPNQIYGKTMGLRSALDGLDIAMTVIKMRDVDPLATSPPNPTVVSSGVLRQLADLAASEHTRGSVINLNASGDVHTLTFWGEATNEELLAAVNAYGRSVSLIAGAPDRVVLVNEDGEVLADFTSFASVGRKPPKVGRNDPCWCGSGKKYKKCHGA
jgi:hypothetical protein